MKSQFDTGNWSKLTELPHERDITNYLEHLLLGDPNKCYTRQDIKNLVAKEFDIPTVAQETPGPGSNTPQYVTSISRIISNSVQGERHAMGNPFLKRVAFSVYQHASGNGELDATMREAFRKKRLVKVSKRRVEEARVSVRLLKSIRHDPETIMCELNGKMWSDDVVEEAIRQEFPEIT